MSKQLLDGLHLVKTFMKPTLHLAPPSGQQVWTFFIFFLITMKRAVLIEKGKYLFQRKNSSASRADTALALFYNVL